MTQNIRDNKTIFELQEESDYVWQDGDDTALYDAGHAEGIKKALDIIDNCLRQEQLDTIPTSWMLKVIRHTIQSDVSGQEYSMVMTTIECPNHEGSFDCTPFCRVCEGEQEILYLASQE